MFLAAGILYLIGVGIILAIKPSFMFSPDGGWKEFSISKTTDHGTVFPFWLFCIVWAIVSYAIVLILTTLFTAETANRGNGTRRNNFQLPQIQSTVENEPEGVELPPGYYMLNKRSKNGAPRYIFIGAEPPE